MPVPVHHTAEAQHAIEAHTAELAEEPAVLAMRVAGETALRAAIPQADPASLRRLPGIADEIMFNALISLADGRHNQDLPRLIQRPPRIAGGRSVAGNRGLHDNPDTFYRLVPLDGRSDFVLEGVAPDHPATIFEVSALSSRWQTLGNLTRDDLGIRPGQNFRIHLGPEPGADCDHFVRLKTEPEMLLIRETLADWERERPCRLTIENRFERGCPRVFDDDQYVGAAAARVEKWFREAVRLTEMPLRARSNVFPPPVLSGEHGKLVTMAYSIGHFHVRPGEALLLRIDPGEAPYVGVPITNLFGTTNTNLATGASLNSRQAEFDQDGRFICVLSLEDPGVTNWLDPDGLERGFLFVRWAGLDPDRPPQRAPHIESELISLRDLDRHLPSNTFQIGPEARQTLRADRTRRHTLRFEEFPDE
jgi:hypothetical protein